MNRNVLISGATGDTGRAMVHGKDDRSAALEKLVLRRIQIVQGRDRVS
jgi:hypothetical protein